MNLHQISPFISYNSEAGVFLLYSDTKWDGIITIPIQSIIRVVPHRNGIEFICHAKTGTRTVFVDCDTSEKTAELINDIIEDDRS